MTACGSIWLAFNQMTVTLLLTRIQPVWTQQYGDVVMNVNRGDGIEKGAGWRCHF